MCAVLCRGPGYLYFHNCSCSELGILFLSSVTRCMFLSSRAFLQGRIIVLFQKSASHPSLPTIFGRVTQVCYSGTAERLFGPPGVKV